MDFDALRAGERAVRLRDLRVAFAIFAGNSGLDAWLKPQRKCCRLLLEQRPRGEQVDIEKLAQVAVDTGLRIHRDLGPGMLESAYEAILAAQLVKGGVPVERQKPVAVEYDGVIVRDAFRVDLLLGGSLIIEVKSIEQLAPIHSRQILTYLRLSGLRVGLLMNFGAATFRQGLKRIVNDYEAPSTSPLLINRPDMRAT
jgi:GxxExxY protein